MSEDMACDNREPVRTDEPWVQRTGRGGTYGRYWNSGGGGVSNTLSASYYKGPGMRSGKEREYLVEPTVYPGVGITDPRNGNNPAPGDTAPSLTNDSRNYLCADGKPKRKYIVRRLTPVECQRLQGFPDGYEDGVPGSDSARYKMWGNGMALPNMYFVMARIAAHERGEEI